MPTRLTRRLETPTDTQMEMEVETPIAAEAEAIVVNQLENLSRELQKFSDHHIWGKRVTEIAYTVVKKLMPEIIVAGEKHHKEDNADSARALQETAELRSTVKDLAKAVNALVACQEARQMTDRENRLPEVQGAQTVYAMGPVYKPTKASRPQTRDTAQCQKTMPRSPKDQYHPARLIVILRGEKFDTNQLNPHRLVNLINNRLAHLDKARHLCVASAHYNYNQNLVIMLREDQKGKELKQHMEEFIDILGVPAHTIKMITDDRQYKVRINGMWTGRNGEGDLNTPGDLMEEIKRFNLILSKVKLIDIAEDLDMQVLDISQANFPTVTVMNIYNQPKPWEGQQMRDASDRLQEIRLPHNRPVIISGDWNQHHPLWSKGDQDPLNKTQNLVDWLQENDFTILNEKGVCTYHEHHRRGATSVIDLTWANANAIVLDTTKEWTIDLSLACRLDHFALRWVIDHGATEVQNPTGTRYNFKDTKPSNWQDVFDQEMGKHAERWESLRNLEANRTPEELDLDVELITEAMKCAMATTAKERKPSDKVRPWWSEALTRANDRRMALQENQCAFKAQWGSQNPEIHREICKMTNYFKRLYKHKKSKWINETLEEATPEKMWGLRGWSKGTRNYPSPAIRTTDGRTAIKHEDKCDALCTALFKPPPTLTENEEPDLMQALDHDMVHVQITQEEVREAIYRHSIKKAPGISQQPFNMVQWAWEMESETIFALMHHCIETGHHPRPWRKAVAVALRKPNKPDYSEPRAYRLIQLLKCMGKVLEGIIARRLSYMVGKGDLVPPTQFGG
ncbi:putative 115 kDa protein in type-1 retrotransposable element [Termitomyces sp. T112]|nr:putative 115 kDa protein in type-1 retrotransposable element [Termitomyces sp. T112]